MRIALLIVAIWLACAPLTFGITNAHFRREFAGLVSASGYDQGREDAEREAQQTCGEAAALTIWGPVGVVLTFLLSGFAQDGLSYNCEATP